MNRCPQCNEKVDESSIFCQNCGAKINNGPKNETRNVVAYSQDSYKKNKTQAMIIFGYLTLFVEIVAILAAWSHVKVINADRIILYPLLCVLLSFFAAFNLVNDEDTFIHSIIIVAISVLLFVFGIIVV